MMAILSTHAGYIVTHEDYFVQSKRWSLNLTHKSSLYTLKALCLPIRTYTRMYSNQTDAKQVKRDGKYRLVTNP